MFDYMYAWSAFLPDRRAVTALEYAIIAGVIVAAILAGFNVFAGDVSDRFNNIGGSL